MARKAVTQKYPMMVHCNPDVAPPLGAFAGVEFRSAIRMSAYHLRQAARANASRFTADEWTLLARFLEERAMEEETPNPADLLADFVEQGLLSLGSAAPPQSKRDKTPGLVERVRGLSYWESWAVLIAVRFRLRHADELAEGEPWWDLEPRRRVIEANLRSK